MNVLHVNYTDKIGHRFNGGAIIGWLRANGHSGQHAVGVKQAMGDISFGLNSILKPVFYRLICRLENALSLQSVLHFQSFLLLFNAAYRRADVVHYHIIHNEFFSYLALPLLTRRKPTVWTLHDPWAFTGHCIHPFECEGWRTGCAPCPHLDYPFAIRTDRAWLNFKLKKFIYSRSKLELIVSSKWMKIRVEQSPLLRHFRVHQIPFGVHLDTFKPGDKDQAKTKLGIPTNKVVIGFRALGGPFKGLQYTLAALHLLSQNLPICIVTCQAIGLCEGLQGKFPIYELGDLENEADMVQFYQATDIHLMPSMAESFGMMAAEAAACGVPSIVFSGTPLVEICFAPEAGIAVEKGNVTLLANAIIALVGDSERRHAMGRRARELAKIHYGLDLYMHRTLDIYRSLMAAGEQEDC